MTAFYERIKGFIPNDKLSSRTEFYAKILLVLYVCFIFLGTLSDMYRIPINKPYYTGAYDEPFSINSGINALHNNGDPIFYRYGGITAYSVALSFYLYCNDAGIVPYYKDLDHKFKGANFPVLRKIYPVKPIFIARVLFFILFIVGSFAYVATFTWLLLPISFFLIDAIFSGKLVAYMSQVVLPDNYLFLLSGLTVLLFIKALLEKKTSRYFLLTVACMIMASITIAVKLSTIFIILLPLSLLPPVLKEKKLNRKQGVGLIGCVVLPYILINPTILVKPFTYIKWLLSMGDQSGTTSGTWFERLPQIRHFIDDLTILKVFPIAVVILLVLIAFVLLIRKNPYAFAAFFIFLFFSLYVLTNMKEAFYARHLMFLMLPLQLLVLYPLIYLFHKSPRQIRAVFTVICLLLTLNAFPPAQSMKKFHRFTTGTFTAKWKKESRDQLEQFVKTNNATLYFYDMHNFSLPNTIHNQILPFSDRQQLPQTLKKDEYIALILYKTSKNKTYNQMKAFLLANYKTVKSFGPANGAHDITFYGPQFNPTILLLKSAN